MGRRTWPKKHATLAAPRHGAWSLLSPFPA
jgi:hypothetical protein